MTTKETKAKKATKATKATKADLPAQVTSAVIAPELAQAVNEAFAPLPVPVLPPEWFKGRAVVPTLSVVGHDGQPRPVGVPGNNGKHGASRAHDTQWCEHKRLVCLTLLEMGAIDAAHAVTASQVAQAMVAAGRYCLKPSGGVWDTNNRVRHHTHGMSAVGHCVTVGEGPAQTRYLTPSGVAYCAAHGVTIAPPAPEVKEPETVKEEPIAPEPTTTTTPKRKPRK